MNHFKPAVFATAIAIALTAAPARAANNDPAASSTLAFGDHGTDGGPWRSQPRTFVEGATAFGSRDAADHDTADGWAGTDRAPGETFTAGRHVRRADPRPAAFSTPVPEPQTYALLLAGLCAMIFMSRRSRR